MLLLSIQEMHRDLDLTLPEGIVYSQRISAPDKQGDHFTIEKRYKFKRGAEVLGEQTLNLGFYRRPLMDEILGDAGFELQGFDPDRRFVVCSKDGARAVERLSPGCGDGCGEAITTLTIPCHVGLVLRSVAPAQGSDPLRG